MTVLSIGMIIPLRILDSTLGRFYSKDPYGYEADINLYCHVGNRPYRFVDPAGFPQVVPASTGGYSIEFDNPKDPCCKKYNMIQFFRYKWLTKYWNKWTDWRVDDGTWRDSNAE